MIHRNDLADRADEWGLSEDVVEKDYVLGWLLWGIATDPMLSKSWVFKGGTCLKKCYFETYRFSEDLDFTILPGGAFVAKELEPVLKGMLARVQEASGIQLQNPPPGLKTSANHPYTEGSIYYRGPRNPRTNPPRVKLDLSAGEPLLDPPVRRRISHPYSDGFPSDAPALCYSFPEVFAEKLRAMAERGRPRDLYDIIHLHRYDSIAKSASAVKELLVKKCTVKGIPYPGLDVLQNPSLLPELESEWKNMLGHQLPSLPPIENFWNELPTLCAWLESEGDTREPLLQSVASNSGESMDLAWRMPATISAWGARSPIERIRYAAANRLLVRLTYKGTHRRVEPYSFRMPKTGKMQFFAFDVDKGGIRGYSVERIEGVAVLDTPYRPRFRVEIGR